MTLRLFLISLVSFPTNRPSCCRDASDCSEHCESFAEASHPGRGLHGKYVPLDIDGAMKEGAPMIAQVPMSGR